MDGTEQTQSNTDSARKLSLTEFLLARIDEDEDAARAAVEVADKQHAWWVDGPGSTSDKWWVYATGENFQHKAVADHIARHDPARVLRECEAKRRIVAAYLAERRGAGTTAIYVGDALEEVLGDLAAPYANHPDYRQEWKP